MEGGLVFGLKTYVQYQSICLWVGGWVDGWVDGWVGGRSKLIFKTTTSSAKSLSVRTSVSIYFESGMALRTP